MIPAQIFSFFTSIFPTGTVNSAFTSSLSTAGNYLKLFDAFIPISTLLTILGLVFSVEIIIFISKFVRWALSFIPFIGGKGV